MKVKQLLLSLFALLIAMTAQAVVYINVTNFPDANFRKWLLEQTYGSDGRLTDGEIASVTYIDVNLKDIKSLQGIEYFTALEALHCYYNQLTTLDMSKNTALRLLFDAHDALSSIKAAAKNAAAMYDAVFFTDRFISFHTSSNFRIFRNSRICRIFRSRNRTSFC